MSKEVAGIPLSRLEVPIWIALKSYQDITDGKLRFEVAKACKLIQTPGKANSARSATDVTLIDTYNRAQIISKLYVIAFKPGDGTGDTTTYKMGDLDVDGPYPNTERVIPRSKKDIRYETHLTVVAHKIDDSHAEPELFKGTFDLLGLKGKTVLKKGELGQSGEKKAAYPKTTFTLGYVDGQRFGDPHAVYSAIPDSLQVCAFIALTEEMDAKLFLEHSSNPLHKLHPEPPHQLVR